MRNVLLISFTLIGLMACSSGSNRPARLRFPTQPMQQGGSPNTFPQPVHRPVNVAALQRLRGKIHCAPVEVAPGEWSTPDCGPHEPVLRVRPLMHNPMSKGFVTGAASLPDQVDHRAAGMEGPIKSQGAVGACTAFSLSTAMDNAVRKLGRNDVISPLHVWSKYAVPKMGKAGDENVDQLLTIEPVWPYDPAKACKLMHRDMDPCSDAYDVSSNSANKDPALVTERKVADTSGRYKLISVEELQARPANIQEMMAVLAAGDDVWAAFWVDMDAWSNKAIAGGVIPDYQQREDTGHAVVISGYRTVSGKRQFLIHNSWGPKWGEGGYAWLSEAMVSKQLKSAYRIRIADTGTTPPSPSPNPQPGPAPTPQPNNGGCPAGQVLDAVFGQCAPVCPSGSPPAAGYCLPTVPGWPTPSQQPSPAPSSQCPQGQAPDMMSGQCMPLCPGNYPAIGGMCLPVPR